MSEATPEVDVNTDDLDAFSNLLNGKAKEAPAAEEVVEDVPVDDTDATEQDEPEEADVEEDAEAEAPEDADNDEDDEDILKPKPKKKQSAQERIAELTRARHEAERREADALRRLAEAEARRSPEPEPKPVTPRTVALDPAAPDPDASHGDGSAVYPLGEFDPLYIRDLTRFTIQKENEAATATRVQQDEARRQQEASVQLQQTWAGKLIEVEKSIPDLRPVIATLESELTGLAPEFGTYLSQTIMGMDVGPEVLYYLANNVDEAQKIIAAGPVGATLALGRLEQKIQMSQAKKAKQPARISAAPQPPVTTRGTATRTAVSDDTDDLDAFEAKFFKRK